MVGTKHRVALHMNNGSPTIEGLLVKNGRREYHLLGATILQDTETTQSLNGRVEVPREHVYCVERLT